MSLIIGIKSQNGAYLASDSRMTFTNPESKISYVEDDWGKYHNFGERVSCVAAGNLSFASYLMQKIEEIKSTLPYITETIPKIVALIQKEAPFFSKIHKLPKAYFIFSGCDPTKPNEIDFTKVVEIAGEKTVSLNEAYIQSALKKSLAQGKGPGLVGMGIPYAGIHGIVVSPDQDGKINVEVLEAAYGECLVYGEGHMTREDITDEKGLLYQVDLQQQNFPSDRDLLKHRTVVISGYFHNLIKEKNLTTVGGSTNVLYVTEKGAFGIPGEILKLHPDGVKELISKTETKDGKMYVLVNGVMKEQKMMSSYFGKVSTSLYENAEI